MTGKNLEVGIEAVVLGGLRVIQVVLVLKVERGHGEQQRFGTLEQGWRS